MSRFVFLDLETTGLDPFKGAEPIELAAVVTDDEFKPLAEFERLIAPERHSALWDPECRKMHERSGLLKRCQHDGLRRWQAGVELVEFLSAHLNAGPLYLAGNSVHFDRKFLIFYWGGAEEMFHRRMVDVSSFRLVGERLTKSPAFPGEKPHRALADVRRSIEELHCWVNAFRQIPESNG